MAHVRATLVAILLIASTHAAAAQSSVIPHPDTLGANFDEKKPGTGTPLDFDFLLGTWTYRIQSSADGGGYGPVQNGTWTAAKTHEGYVVEDQFSTRGPDGTHGVLVTYRVFDPAAKVWRIQGIAAKKGNGWQPGTGWADGADRVMVQDNPQAGRLMRIRYYAISANHFLWRADGSLDGGKTWRKDVILIEANRAGGP